MFRLFKYIKNYKKESILAPLFKFLEASFELLIPLVMVRIIDIGIKNRDIEYVKKMSIIMVILGIIGLLCSLVAQFFAAKAAVGFGSSIRRDLFQHIQSLSYNEIDKIGSSTMITRLTSDVNQIQTGFNLLLRLFLRSPCIVFGAMVMAFTINMKAAFVFVVTIPVISVFVLALMIISIPIYKKVQNKLDKVLLLTKENLAGVRVIRAFNRQKDESEAFESASSDLVKTQLMGGNISALLNPFTYVMINLAIVTLVWIGGKQVYKGIITQGEVVALVNYMSQILVELVKLAFLIIMLTKSLACGNRVNQLLQEEASVVDTAETKIIPKDGPSVEFKDVGFLYQGAKEEALSNLTFVANKGQTIGVIGGTGSGKSSLVNLIPRFYDVISGEVLVNGVNVKEYSLQQLRSKIGIVPQKAVLFRGTIRENMRWGKKDATDKEIWEALEIAQAKEIVELKDGGLDALVLQEGKNLSGGQRQRLTIARALVKKPEILILDDSSSALDYATDAKLRRAIQTISSNTTVFLVSQRAATIKNADKILVLDDGKIVGSGTHEQLILNCEVYQEICLSQLSKEEVQ
ncbi:ABC transporter ATP-binding protein [Anaerosacchariphilus polymeriproducens]|uniref:ABC transporter ATP-binding protein n=1 Tax=Anaerosacchariphilus polymeriproducens TaxID=1812858 RepID=A0A371ASE4_9FIRM|nr:ABC transporter ATP-binding protein [Anaerosacchariphilus polymeriproducens]RDU22484.1 ABC transporter ATP-binding protein [Anaerosacchariphilus polymeriproducens]